MRKAGGLSAAGSAAGGAGAVRLMRGALVIGAFRAVSGGWLTAFLACLRIGGGVLFMVWFILEVY